MLEPTQKLHTKNTIGLSTANNLSMNVIIIGNGIAGTTAARFIRKQSDAKITMISGESTYPFSRTALMYIYMGHMKYDHTKLYEDGFWKKNNIDLIQKWVTQIDFDKKEVQLSDGSSKSYDKLIIATGSKPNKFGWPGENLNGVQGLYHLQDLEKMETASAAGIKRAVIVGGGLIGVEMAEMFHSRHVPVTFLVREESFWNPVLPEAESLMVGKHIVDQGIDLRLGEELSEVLDDGTGNVKSIKTKSGEEIECNFVGLTVGVSPNVEFLKTTNLNINRGIQVNEYLETSQADVYAIGDCVEITKPAPGRRPIEAVWYAGRMMAQVAAANVTGKKLAYDPGTWFNSAKFFDIEYQVYGDISPKEVDGVSQFYWEHPNLPKSLRIAFDAQTLAVKGFNLMGIRYRQEVCTSWIENKVKIDDVMTNLKAANFDPEFFKMHEEDMIKAFNKKYSKNIVSRGKRKLSFIRKLMQTNG